MKKILILVTILLLTGCDYKELSDISIGTILGIDKQNDEYTISCLVVGKKENETLFYNGKGTSITTALANLNSNLSENLYLNHIQTVLVSDKIAKEGMRSILDYFIKNDSIQNNFYLFLAHNASSEEILQTLLKNSQSNYNIITNIFKYNDQMQLSYTFNSIAQFLDSLLKKGKEPTLNSVTISGDKVSASKLGIFKGDKLRGFSDNTMGISLLNGEAGRIIVNIPCSKGESIIEIKNIKLTTKYKKKKITNEIKGTISIEENACDFSIKNEKDKNFLLKKVQENVKNILNKTIRESQTLDSDIFGYGNIIYQKQKKIPTSYFSTLKIENKLSFKISKENSKEIYHE